MVFKWIDRDEYWGQLERTGGIKVVYQPDDIRFNHIREMMVKMRRYCDYALMFDQTGAEIAKAQIGFKSAEPLLLTADDELYRPVDVYEKDIDFCFVGSLGGHVSHASRRRMIELLMSAGYNVHVRHDLYDIEELNLLYNRSKVVLNHATDIGQPFGQGYGFQCRHFEAGFTGACILTNRVIPDYDHPYLNMRFLKFSNEDELLDHAAFLMASPLARAELGRGLLEELKEHHTPQARVTQLLDILRSFT